MRRQVFIILVAATACASEPQGSLGGRAAAARDPRLIGTWLLESTRIGHVASGEVRPDPVRGANPRGIATFDAHGYMANQTVNADRTMAAVEAKLKGARGERAWPLPWATAPITGNIQRTRAQERSRRRSSTAPIRRCADRSRPATIASMATGSRSPSRAPAWTASRYGQSSSGAGRGDRRQQGFARRRGGRLGGLLCRRSHEPPQILIQQVERVAGEVVELLQPVGSKCAAHRAVQQSGAHGSGASGLI